MVKYLILDVDGTFTDGSIYYDDCGNELKKFCTKDGTGIICGHLAGIKMIVLSGRECAATVRRMKELHIDEIYQNIKDKVSFLRYWIEDNHIDKHVVGYIGDDINDLAPMALCGFVGCPNDAAEEVKAISNYVSTIKGGHGAVRDCIEHILREEGIWAEVVKKAYGAGI